ncbi:hypothetical protein ACWYRQ_21705, partial [Clostridioides difficile]
MPLKLVVIAINPASESVARTPKDTLYMPPTARFIVLLVGKVIFVPFTNDELNVTTELFIKLGDETINCALFDDNVPAAPVAPVGPVIPFAPVAPVGPIAPIVPATPVAPVGPIVPATPVAPVAPTAPVGPVFPSAPVAPVGPVGPISPFAPVGPVAPAIPVAPIAPVAPTAPVASGTCKSYTISTSRDVYFTKINLSFYPRFILIYNTGGAKDYFT